MLLLAACAVRLVGGALLPGLEGDQTALLQDAVRVHTQPDEANEVDEWFVDNSNLHHKGPGVLWRLSKDISNVVGKGVYAAWGSTVQGVDEDGWVKVGSNYLPTMVHGAVVLVKKARVRRVSYKSTRVRAPDGSWLSCSITGPGSMPGTFNVMVKPPTIEDYPIENVPADALERVEEDTGAVPAPAKQESVTGQVPPSARVEISDLERRAEMFLKVKVVNLQGNVMELKFHKKSPLRTLMRMSCDRSRVEWQKCQQEVRFEYQGKEVGGDARYDVMGLQEGDTISMSWKSTPTPMPRKKRRAE